MRWVDGVCARAVRFAAASIRCHLRPSRVMLSPILSRVIPSSPTQGRQSLLCVKRRSSPRPARASGRQAGPWPRGARRASRCAGPRPTPPDRQGRGRVVVDAAGADTGREEESERDRRAVGRECQDTARHRHRRTHGPSPWLDASASAKDHSVTLMRSNCAKRASLRPRPRPACLASFDGAGRLVPWPLERPDQSVPGRPGKGSTLGPPPTQSGPKSNEWWNRAEAL